MITYNDLIKDYVYITIASEKEYYELLNYCKEHGIKGNLIVRSEYQSEYLTYGFNLNGGKLLNYSSKLYKTKPKATIYKWEDVYRSTEKTKTLLKG